MIWTALLYVHLTLSTTTIAATKTNSLRTFAHRRGRRLSMGIRPKQRGLNKLRANSRGEEVVDLWTGENDRKDLPPLPIPNISGRKRVVLVRHGQSTWNKIGRIQGSSDFSVLTDKGKHQAEATGRMLSAERFDSVYQSPLSRVVQTADIICEASQFDMSLIRTQLASLREIDLYGFQGLMKEEGKARYGTQYDTWKRSPESFIIDDHKPVVELWYRASVAWQRILRGDDESSNILVVAHNAINQALLGVALGLDPSYFRKIVQDNAAVTVLEFLPEKEASTSVIVDRINQSPNPRISPSPMSEKEIRIVLLDSDAPKDSSLDSLFTSDCGEMMAFVAENDSVGRELATTVTPIVRSYSSSIRADVWGYLDEAFEEGRDALIVCPQPDALKAVLSEMFSGERSREKKENHQQQQPLPLSPGGATILIARKTAGLSQGDEEQMSVELKAHLQFSD